LLDLGLLATQLVLEVVALLVELADDDLVGALEALHSRLGLVVAIIGPFLPCSGYVVTHPIEVLIHSCRQRIKDPRVDGCQQRPLGELAEAVHVRCTDSRDVELGDDLLPASASR